ncbi:MULTISPECIES: 3-deoxy-7-phosphoheptulonate synthase [Oceanimonas]|uniref:Phospho-2-dehydro-3-deoxyheptonate aldolase n=1 Tax=Oceanimonas doudoroffii TaxID=84158 RepID=A0A233RFR8_9GAMM|nr:MULTISPECIES: 3-deoxy-7-phosphoheptulonate synthase [Oceanimonas]NHI01756.1 Phospho-2-dehydro-3-deoxyheptonate aldolase, Trp-sensitive [Oceanimonas sp. MB9]OXY82242.1 3-deoxy-7-phosphoheptulonate synthase [Oceanimonas doudoroffii]
MSHSTDELRSRRLASLTTPHQLAERYPLTDTMAETVLTARSEIEAILSGDSHRLLVIIGPCSIHDPQAALAYAERLAPLKARYADKLCIVMRTYFEKPRTIVGWKGLINDPHLDGSFDINTGLALARKLLGDINALGLPTATEFLDMVTGQYIADMISWGAIGARTTESQIHREMASALSCPVGFKNGTDGNIQIALDAVRAAAHGHIFCSPDKDGQMTIYQTDGNPYGHVILRGGKTPNYDAQSIEQAAAGLHAVGLSTRLVVDLSHGNSQKQHQRQLAVADDIARQLEGGSRFIAGVMIESFIEPGRQDVEGGKVPVFGQSITDACLGWQDSEQVLERLYRAVP